MSHSNNLRPEYVFQVAKKRFLSSLSEVHRDNFVKHRSVDDVITAVGSLIDQESKKAPRLNTALKKIHRFGQHIQPYFEVVGLFVSSNPEYAAIAWGAVRLALTLASNYVTFFEKLSASLQKITEEIPRYNDKYLLLLLERPIAATKKASKGFQLSLCQAYIDILAYFQAVIDVFTNTDGKPRNAATIFAKIVWKPFDVRFNDLFKSLNDHFHAFNEDYELSLRWKEADSRMKAAEERQRAQIDRANDELAREMIRELQKETSEINQLLMDQTRERMIHRSQKWLAPPSYVQEYELLRKMRCENTAEWIFEEKWFKKWLKSNKKHSNTSKENCTELNQQDGPAINPHLMEESDLDAAERKPNYAFTLETNTHEPKAVELTDKDDSGCERVIWINGNPGSGKSMLAASSVEYLSHHQDEGSIAYFFFRDQDPALRSSAAALRSILAQLLCKHGISESVLDVYILASTSNSSGQLTAAQEELEDVLQIVLSRIGDCVIILDALDECEDEDVLLSALNATIEQTNSRIMLFSRPVLRHGMAGEVGEIINIGESNLKDIATFLRKGLHELRRNNYLPSDSEDATILDRLLLGSDGMFLWAHLMMLYLRLPVLTRRQRLNSITEVTMPEGLEVMYDRLMAIIKNKHRVERDFAYLVLSFITYAARPLTCNELAEILKLSTNNRMEEDEEYTDLDSSIMVSCAGFLEKARLIDPRHNSSRNYYRLVHISAKEYFSSANHSMGQSFHSQPKVISRTQLDSTDAHLHYSTRCLRYLTYHVPAQQLTTIHTQADMLLYDETFPLLNYATVHWTQHFQVLFEAFAVQIASGDMLNQSHLQSECVSALANFMNQKAVLLAWIESSYIFKTKPAFQPVIKWMGLVASGTRTKQCEQLQRDCIEFEIYLRTLENDWGSKILATPSLLWSEAIAFNPCRLLPQSNDIQFRTLVSGKPSGRHLFPRHLCRISEITSDGNWIVILSIWPSRAFNAAFLDDPPDTSQIRESCKGWVARVEIWQTGETTERVANMEVPLDQGEVWIQVQQSLITEQPLEDGKLKWKMSFPLAIHPTGRCFAVLRSVYWLPSKVKRSSSHEVFIKSALIPLTYDPKKWSVDMTDNLTINFSYGSRCPSTHSYSLHFSSNGNFLSLTQNERENHLEITTFGIALENFGKPQIKFLKCIRAFVTPQPAWRKSFKLVFHPTGRALAFLCDQRAYLWEFGIDQACVMPCPARFPRIDSVSFSHCGRFLVLDDNFGKFPVLRAVSQLIQEEIVLSNDARNHDSTNPSRCSSTGMQLRNAESQVIRERDTGLTINNNTFQLDRGPRNSKSIVCNRYDRFGDKNSLELITLPDWPDMEATNISLKLPRSRDDMIQIIMNKAETAWYSPSDPEDTHFPAIVRHDQVALATRLLHGVRRQREHEDSTTESNKRRCLDN